MLNKRAKIIIFNTILLMLIVSFLYWKMTGNKKTSVPLSVKITQPTPSPINSPTPTLIPTPTLVAISPTKTPSSTPAPTTAPLQIRKVAVIWFNPIFPNHAGKTINEYMRWNNPVELENQMITDILTDSHGQLRYKIVERTEVPAFPVLYDGFQYTEKSWLVCAANHTTCHTNSMTNYNLILSTHQICEKVNTGTIDELWMWAGPWVGNAYEAVMTGPNSFNTNGGPITGTTCNRQLHMMTFNPERGVAEMLEDMGHRAEGTFKHLFGSWNPGEQTHDWNKFTGYDYVNTSSVQSNCEAWLSYPPAPSSFQAITCSAWGCTNRGYFNWWFTHLPHAEGKTNSKLNNWWKYFIDFENAMSL